MLNKRWQESKQASIEIDTLVKILLWIVFSAVLLLGLRYLLQRFGVIN